MRYAVVLLHDQELGGYAVQVPDLPGCFSQGDTVEEALEHAREAIEGHIEALLLVGEEIPEPTDAVLLGLVEAQPDLSLTPQAATP